MKRCLVIIIWLSICSCAYGVHFTYYDGHVRGAALAYARQGVEENGPESDIEESIEACKVEKVLGASDEMGGTISAACQSIASMIDPNAGDDVVFVSAPLSIVRADGSSPQGDANAIGSTQDPDTYGIFYRIEPDGNQEYGDLVRVWYEWRIVVTHHIGSSTYAYAGGPRDGNNGAYDDMSYMAITRNIEPPVTGDFGPEDVNNIVWFRNNIEIEDDDYYESSQHLEFHPSFLAQIGDVIGIFAENQTLIEASGSGVEVMQGHVTIILHLSYLEGDLDFNGKVNWLDFVIFAENWLAGIE